MSQKAMTTSIFLLARTRYALTSPLQPVPLKIDASDL